MANTKIQIKRSNATAAPVDGSLSAGELAYSYNSDKLFIANSTGTGVIEIGGGYWMGLVNSAFAKANSASAQGMDYPFVNTTVGYANSWANTVGTAGNNYTNSVGVAGNNYAIQVGAASNTWANAVGTAGNNYTIAVGTAGNNYSIQVGAASNTWANGLSTIDRAIANSAANSANAYSLATFYPKTGGTISGDVVVTGNLTISGLTTYTNTNTLLVGDNIITLNADIPNNAAPTENAGIEVNRGSANANAAIIWNEAVDKWQLSSNLALGSTYVNITSNTDLESVAVSANAYATAVGQAGNNYTNSVGTAGNNYTNAVGTAGNNYTNSVGTAGNNYTNAVGVAGNNYANTVSTADRAVANAAANSANAYTVTVGAASNTWANTIGQNWANTRLANVVAGAGHTITWATTNGYTNATIALSTTTVAAATYGGTDQIASFAVDSYGRLTFAGNNGINVGAATAGTLPVARGGTGNTTFTANSVLIGNGTNPVWGLFSSTEGHVLQVSAAGAPQFAMLDGGSF